MVKEDLQVHLCQAWDVSYTEWSNKKLYSVNLFAVQVEKIQIAPDAPRGNLSHVPEMPKLSPTWCWELKTKFLKNYHFRCTNYWSGDMDKLPVNILCTLISLHKSK